ncbi:MAG: NAD(+)/NADH kinase [Caldisphaera sp.]|nr:NAD(+)/NADH kinase [Caldisphaera sp.]
MEKLKRDKYGIVVKPNSNKAEKIAEKVIDLLKNQGINPLIEYETKQSYKSFSSYEEFKMENNPPEKIIVIGGDGTLLRAVIRIKNNNSIFMSIRAGKRGFLLDVEEYEIENRVLDFIENRYALVEYPRLLPIFNQEEGSCAMNDIVIFTADGSLVKLIVNYENNKIYSIDGDGVVISTTIGSTAYSLSAGGPIIDPRLNAIVIAPLNPVQLHIRPVVLPYNGLITIESKEDSGSYYINIDGQEKIHGKSKSLLQVKPCKYVAKIARFNWWDNYYERLFNRLLTYW